MDQRGAVQQLEDRSETNRARAAGWLTSSIPCGQEQQRRSQAFPSPAEKITGDFRDGLEGGRGLPRQFLLDQDEIVPDKVKNFPYGEQRDGLPPDAQNYNWPLLMPAAQDQKSGENLPR